MLKIVSKVLHFSLLQKGNKNTIYVSKVMCSLYIFFMSSLVLDFSSSSVRSLRIPFFKS